MPINTGCHSQNIKYTLSLTQRLTQMQHQIWQTEGDSMLAAELLSAQVWMFVGCKQKTQGNGVGAFSNILDVYVAGVCSDDPILGWQTMKTSRLQSIDYTWMSVNSPARRRQAVWLPSAGHSWAPQLPPVAMALAPQLCPTRWCNWNWLTYGSITPSKT